MEPFYANILLIVDKNISAKNITASNYLPWMTLELKQMIERKQYLYNRAKRFNQPNDWKLYAVPCTYYFKAATP